MTENRPSSRDLAIDARQFVRDNKAYFWDYLKPFLILLVIADAAAHIGPHISPAFGLAALAGAYFSACFILAWHRAVLLGPEKSLAVRPFALQQGEGKFIAVFFGVALIPVAVMFGGFIPVIVGAVVKNTAIVIIGTLIAVAAFAYALVMTLGYVFVLPARSVNVKISFREARKISRGLIWRLFSAGFRVSFWMELAIGLWFFASAVIISLFPGMTETVANPDGDSKVRLSLIGEVLVYIVAGLPALYVNFIILARNVTVLSKLYQWSVQNRPLPPPSDPTARRGL